MKTCLPPHMGDSGLSVNRGCSGWRQWTKEQSCLITQCDAFWSPLKSSKDLLKGHQMKYAWRQPNGGQAWDCSHFSNLVPQLLCTPHVRLLNVISSEQKKPPTLDNGVKSFLVGQKLVVWNRVDYTMALACFLRIPETMELGRVAWLPISLDVRFMLSLGVQNQPVSCREWPTALPSSVPWVPFLWLPAYAERQLVWRTGDSPHLFTCLLQQGCVDGAPICPVSSIMLLLTDSRTIYKWPTTFFFFFPVSCSWTIISNSKMSIMDFSWCFKPRGPDFFLCTLFSVIVCNKGWPSNCGLLPLYTVTLNLPVDLLVSLFFYLYWLNFNPMPSLNSLPEALHTGVWR